MRVTQSMLRKSMLQNIRRSMSQLAEAQQNVATGKRVHTVSDDPVAATQIMRAARGLRTLQQYRRNSSAARARLNTEEAVLSQITDVMARAREIATATATDTISSANMAAAEAEAGQLLDQAIQLANTSVAGEHIFGGHQTAAPPFQSDGTYVGDTGVHETDIGTGFRIRTNHTGQELLVSSGVISSVTALQTSLQAGDKPGIQKALASLTAAFDEVQVLLADTGARLRQLDVAGENLEALDTMLTASKQTAEEIDLEEAVVELFGIQTTLQAALASSSRILNANLTEYLF